MNTATRIALVTGANRGIGLETVRQLAAAGVHTLLAGRDLGRAEQAAAGLQAEGLPVEAIALDVVDPGSIAAAAARIEAQHGRLDILVNNAGVMLDDDKLPPSAQSMQQWRETFDTNLFGVVETTRALLPLLKLAPAARIVNVSSGLGSLSMHADPESPIYHYKPVAYDVSKSAVNAWTIHLAYELRDTPIKVNTIHPGSVKTDMNAGGDLGLEAGARTSVQMALLGADGPSGSFTHLGRVLPW